MTVDCIAPEEIQEGELLAYLDGSIASDDPGRQRIEAHLAKCSACNDWVYGLQRVDVLFKVTLFRQDCPDLDDLLQYQAGFLLAAAHQSIQQHLTICSYCQSELTQLANLEPGSQSLILPAVPTLQQWVEAGRRLIRATLLPAPQTSLALRGQQPAQQTFQAHPYQITLISVSPLVQGDDWEIQGQIIHEDVPLTTFQGVVELWQDEQRLQTENMDEFGFFIFNGIGSGRYSLRVVLKAEILVIDTLLVA